MNDLFWAVASVALAVIAVWTDKWWWFVVFILLAAALSIVWLNENDDGGV